MTPQPDLADRPASPTDVARCYGLFLQRPIESAAVARAHLADNPTLWTLIRRFQAAPETQRLRLNAASRMIRQDQDGRGVVLDRTEAQSRELLDHIEQVWSRYGREDAYFSVLTHPRFAAGKLTAQDIDAFYSSGQVDVADLLFACRRNHIEPDPAWSVLELGCGLARMGEAFASQFAAYRGVDISAAHLAIARERLQSRNLENVAFDLLGDFLAGAAGYDLLYSILVLQHNPPPVIHDLLDACLARLNPGGYAFFQVPCFLYDYSFETGAYLAGDGRKQEMEIHALPQQQVFALLARHGLTPIEVTPDERIGAIGISYTFLAHKRR